MPMEQLKRYVWLSIAAALTTISLKSGAYFLTGSVGLLSDALESVVNLVAAVLTLVLLSLAARPPDEEHVYGHTKAEYFSSGIEGALILMAAASIGYTAIHRLLHPQMLDQIGVGLAISVLASLINFGVARVLLQTGQRYGSLALEADARHLMTDVWTSIGVIAGVGAVALTGWQWLDSVIALVVALNILWTAFQLMRESALGLLDTALPASELEIIACILESYQTEHITYHSLRTRRAGMRRFMSVHILVPGSWSVQRGHDLLERIERDLRGSLTNLTVLTHLEPIEDPVSMDDKQLDRPTGVASSPLSIQQD